MSGGARAERLCDGRLHLQHGPIDLIVEAFGDERAAAAAYQKAIVVFRPLLAELMEDVATLRTPVHVTTAPARGQVARAMVEACRPHTTRWVTPMAAVAGAVADRVLAALTADGTLTRAYVNNGGDIALYLTPEQWFDVGIVAELDRPRIVARARVWATCPVRGVATSGFGGRSLSFGIADAVTVLATDGAAADVAATLIANAVNVDAPTICRRPACRVRDDTDLGDRPVTTAVGELTVPAIAAALDAGAREAASMRDRGLIAAAYLSLRGHHRIVAGPVPLAPVWNGDGCATVVPRQAAVAANGRGA